MVSLGSFRSFVSISFGLLTLVAGCGSGSSGPAATTVEGLTASGPFAVGKVTLNLVDGSRVTPATGNSAGSDSRILVTDVYYPASTGNRGDVYVDASPATSEGGFPLVVVAHGLYGQRTTSTATLELLASQGYVVAAPDFPLTNFSTYASETVWLPDLFQQPGDVSFVIDSLTGTGDPIANDLVGIVDGDRVGLTGHSFGGATVLLTGFSGPLADPRIDAIVALSPFTCFFGSESFADESVPLLLVHGSSDAILEQIWSDELDGFTRAPKIYAKIVGGDHMGFTSDPTRPKGERDLEFFTVVSGAQEAAEATLADFAVAAIGSVPGADLARCALRPLIALPGQDRDPLISMERQRTISDATMILFFDAYVRGNSDSHNYLFDGLENLAPEMQITTKQ